MTSHKKNDSRFKVLEYIEKFLRASNFPPTVRDIKSGLKFKTTSHVQYHLDKLQEEGYILREEHQSRTIQILPKGMIWLQQKGMAPSLAQPRLSTPISNPSTRRPALRNAFYVNRSANLSVARTLRTIQMPVSGRIFASPPTAMHFSDASVSMFDPDTILNVNLEDLPARVNPNELFALEVSGELMIDAGIQDGDYVIVRQTENAENGEMCVIWLEDPDETTLKYFFRENGHYRLQPANATMQPIIIEPSRQLHIRGRVVQVVRLSN